MRREVQEPSTDEYGAEVHPAFGQISASRVSSSPPGAVLFDSEVRHGHYVVLRIGRATRSRDGNRDWIHGGSKDLIEVAMSEAQWASFVSSMNTSGVPCTILRTEADGAAAGLPYAPRLALARQETTSAAEHAFARIKEARDAYEAKKNAANLRALHFAIEHATANVDYATKPLAEHSEVVVQKARADIEAMVTHKATQLGIDPAQIAETLEIEGKP